MDTITLGDNLPILQQMGSETIDMIYIDPPFFSKRHYHAHNAHSGANHSFSDTWKGGINTYIDWLQARLAACYRVLKPNGTLFLHCDWHADAYIRVQILDPLFGYQHLINQIAWCYNVGGRSQTAFAKKHDTIFWYAKGDTWTFNSQHIKIAMQSGQNSFGGRLCTDPDGRLYRLVYGTKTKTGDKRYYKYYLDEGKTPEDWWTDINSLHATTTERWSYPTQKPEALLERLILVATHAGDTILDPFAGSGTTLAVARRLGRHYVGIDQSEPAVALAQQRLAALEQLLTTN